MISGPDTGASVIVTRCSNCDKAYKIHTERLPTGISSFPCRACGELISISQPVEKVPDPEEGKILVVVEEQELGKLILRILSSKGFQGHLATSGEEATGILEEEVLDLLLVSVFLPDMMGYDLLDKVGTGQFGKRLPSILLSAIHHAARYKRAPTSLYGADDYIERHHLPDLLVPKVQRLLSTEENSSPKITPDKLPPPTDDQVLLRRDLETLEKTGQVPEYPQLGDIQRMCRVIAGDIALYNEDVIATTPPGELLDAIASDLSEGEALLLSKFPEMEDQLSRLLKGEILRLLNSRGIQIS